MRAATSRCWQRSAMTPEVNVLFAASRSDHPHHVVARTWLEGALAATEFGAAFTLMPMVAASVLRRVTSPKIFLQPTPIADAVDFVDVILAKPGVRLVPLGPEWPKLRQLCIDKQIGGNDLPDASLAAAENQLGKHLVSFDRDFKKLLGRARFTLLQARGRSRSRQPGTPRLARRRRPRTCLASIGANLCHRPGRLRRPHLGSNGVAREGHDCFGEACRRLEPP